MVFCFIVSAAYGGNLRAFLMDQDIEPPLDTIEKLVASGLPWNWVVYGHSSEDEIATSKNLIHRQFWEEKEEVPYDPFPYERVRLARYRGFC